MTVLVTGGYRHQVTPSPLPRDLRASDADRERVVKALSEAAGDGRLTQEEHSERVQRAYQARTLGELAVLTEDLLAPSAQPLRLEAPGPVNAFFTTQRREGRWVVPERFSAVAVGGHIVIDLREALLQSLHTVIAAVLIGGQLHLLVPEGVQVVVTRARAPGQGEVRPAPHREPAMSRESPLVEVRAFTLAGGVRVHTPRRPGGRWPAWFGRRDRRP